MLRFRNRRPSTTGLIALALVTLGCRENASIDATARTATDSAVTTPAAVERPALAGVLSVTSADEATRDSALVATRDSLLAIVARRDTAALVTYLDPDVKYSFGGDGGRGGFLAFWRTHYTLDALWRTLHDVLSHGGRFSGPALFSAPWTFTALPDSLDAFTHLVVRDSLVPVRLVASDTAVPIGTLSHAVVRASSMELAPRDSLWRAVVLADQRTGFVPAANVRSPVDWRVGFGRHNGRWVIQLFVVGD
jgi:hypothetical protein